jgi:hypothetical protein
VWVAAGRAETVELLDTFRPDGGFHNVYGHFVSAGSPYAAMFKTPATGAYYLDHVDLAVKGVAFGGATRPGSVRFSLRPNSAGGEPTGVMLDMVQRNDITQNFTTYADVTYTFNSVMHPRLQPNTVYWAVLENMADDTVKPYWFQNDTGEVGTLEEYRNESWFHYPPPGPLPAMRIVGNTVPEPAGMLVVVMAGVGLCGRRIRGWWRRG